MKVADPVLPQNPDTDYARDLNFKLIAILRTLANKVNALGAGSASAIDNQATAAPTTGTWAQGDFVKNSNPSELGTAGSKYVVVGFLCVVGGTPGTWLSCRFLTGN